MPTPHNRDRSALRILLTSMIGSAIEWYDFYLYSTASALVLGPLFFPKSSPQAQILAVFATYAAGFLARPIGGLLAGHLGDRVGRKSILVLTLGVMGMATFLVGLLPTSNQVGVLAPALLIVLRVLQGIGIGGEWGGGVLLAVENAPPGRGGWYSSWPLLGFPVGLALSTLTWTALAQLPRQELLSWGWRLPFLASVVLVGIGLYVRLGIAETPEFSQARAAGEVVRLPVAQVLREQPRHVLCGLLAALGVGSTVSLYSVFLLSTVATGGGRHDVALTALVISAALQCLSIPLFATLSDRIGRKPLMVFGYAVAAATTVPALLWFDSGNLLAVSAIYVMAISIGHGGCYGNLAAFLSELFPPTRRFSALAVTYQVGVTVASFLPLAATAIASGTRMTVDVALLFCGVATVAAIATSLAPQPFMPSTTTPVGDHVATVS
ncbi:hypothetical protein ThrDRAFT_04432 [Frankia casuarinae]|uniref:Major facilitator superfamily MFS_1 n=1 Tax=Frankia casuarinae (strain DSM 45818 / CECT 9043 / HFP020203 / CcI3) TaxID=106370 RepID=Q2JC48_FRACC|nr:MULTISPECIES: MFS transporter [Frankia]ABD11144.1 major facilitator superfamily MFS_1 [Frankia casuarinae]ETA00798.1 hypothetical protein CcI6DRAFT_03739 [Frankia sp. CcI6]EYT89951.1 hypothetical protein ThrDRAFT_04432 [Frankia casuarinae]KFB03352.1 Major Facilitator Superfamily transporter [Frankia sp. Allo2]